MTKPRSQQISLEATPFYHLTNRCTRKAFLCGIDQLTGRSYEHRRHIIEQDILRLSSIFFIDVAAFAVLSNHFHIVVHVNQPDCLEASPQSIVQRWHSIFSGTEASQKFINGQSLEPHERLQLDVLIDTWRNRLYSISWFMKVLNENIARQANKEDECTGHFWEARFKSQALLDEKAVLSCMAYVDLNPVRAGTASTPEQSDHTSIKLRIEYWRKAAEKQITGTQRDSDDELQPKSLMPFVGNPRQPMPPGIPFNLVDYIELLDWTGRAIRDDRKGAIPDELPPALNRLAISPEHWIELTLHFEDRFKGIVGSVSFLETHCQKFALKRLANRTNSQLLFC